MIKGIITQFVVIEKKVSILLLYIKWVVNNENILIWYIVNSIKQR